MEIPNFEYIITAQLGEEPYDKFVGYINYSLPEKENGFVELKGIHVDIGYRRRGIGKELVSRFVKAVGSGRKVITTSIINNDSLEVLESLEPQRGAHEAVTVVFKEPEVLRTIPLIMLLEAGNLSVVSVTVKYNPRENLKNTLFLISKAKVLGVTR